MRDEGTDSPYTHKDTDTQTLSFPIELIWLDLWVRRLLKRSGDCWSALQEGTLDTLLNSQSTPPSSSGYIKLPIQVQRNDKRHLALESSTDNSTCGCLGSCGAEWPERQHDGHSESLGITLCRNRLPPTSPYHTSLSWNGGCEVVPRLLRLMNDLHPLDEWLKSASTSSPHPCPLLLH